MITTLESADKMSCQLLQKVVCPICLSPLDYIPVDHRRSNLTCKSCQNTFYLVSGLPVLLIGDENWRKKTDEMEGEVQYNVKKIPREVHLAGC